MTANKQMMRGVVATLWLAVVGLLTLSACDRQDDVPDEVLRSASEPSTQPLFPPRPTTQALLQDPRTPIVLDTLPLRMNVPPGWQITRHSAAVVWLEGPTPHSDARISLKVQETMRPDQFEMYLKGSRRDQEEDKEAVIEIREAGPMTIVDRRTFLSAVTTPVLDGQGIAKLDDKGEIVMQTYVPMRWWVNCLVPFEDRADWYELSFVLITKDQYEADKAFLEGILSTLEYIGPRPAAASTAPATQPGPR